MSEARQYDSAKAEMRWALSLAQTRNDSPGLPSVFRAQQLLAQAKRLRLLDYLSRMVVVA
jgi:hypothetical protein